MSDIPGRSINAPSPEHAARQARLRQKLAAGLPPPERLIDAPPTAVQAQGAPEPTPAPLLPAPAPAGALFTAADLLGPLYAPVEFRIMGKCLWVHALSCDETIWVGHQVARQLKELRETEETKADLRLSYIRAWQAVACCRSGPEAGAARVFDGNSVPLLLKNLPAETLERIGRTCDEIGGDEDEQRQVLRDFFAGVGQLCETLHGQASEPRLQTALFAFGSLASSVSWRGKLLASDLDALREIGAGG